MKVSIIVCTYNRRDLLKQLIDGLIVDTESLNDTEVIVVNNNSTDGTSALIQSYTLRLSIREVIESQQGITYCRNRGVRESIGEVLIFLDDDILPQSTLLREFKLGFAAFPQTEYFGARIKPYWPDGKPTWVKDEDLNLLRGLFGNHDYGAKDMPYSPSMDHPFGATFAIRRSLIETIGEFNEILPRGEETDLFHRANGAGIRGVYLGKAMSQHKVELQKLKLGALYRSGFSAGQANQRIFSGDQRNFSCRQVLVYLLKASYQLCKGRGDRARQCLINIAILLGQYNASKEQANT